MSEANEFAEQIAAADPPIDGGNIRVFGDWFGGRPFDNLYFIRAVEADGDSLRFVLDGPSTLTLYAPRGLTIDRYGFRLEDASSARLEWAVDDGGTEYVDLDRERGTEQLPPHIRGTSADDRRRARALEIWQEVPPVYLE